MTDDRLPYVDSNLIRYLKEVYETSSLVRETRHMRGERAYGFIEGVTEVLNRLQYILDENEG